MTNSSKTRDWGIVGIILTFLGLTLAVVNFTSAFGVQMGELKTIAQQNVKNIDLKASTESVNGLRAEVFLKADASLMAAVDKIAVTMALLDKSNGVILEKINTININQQENLKYHERMNKQYTELTDTLRQIEGKIK